MAKSRRCSFGENASLTRKLHWLTVYFVWKAWSCIFLEISLSPAPFLPRVFEGKKKKNPAVSSSIFHNKPTSSSSSIFQKSSIFMLDEVDAFSRSIYKLYFLKNSILSVYFVDKKSSQSFWTLRSPFLLIGLSHWVRMGLSRGSVWARGRHWFGRSSIDPIRNLPTTISVILIFPFYFLFFLWTLWWRNYGDKLYLFTINLRFNSL